VALPPYRFGLLHAPPPADEAALTPWAHWLARVFALHQQQQDLWFMAMRDELTGAWNRRYFQRFLKLVLDRAAADQLPVTLMIFDIDDFKRYNDRHGHGAGDDILRETVKLLQSLVRKDDVVARIGGDEFAVIYWDPHGPRRADSKPPADVIKAAERFRKAISQHRFPKLTGAPGPLTVSAGLASFPADGATPDELIARADAMAMQSKQQGKNALTFGSA
jgi:diguanylate cyclase (GGDEF)-like protein